MRPHSHKAASCVQGQGLAKEGIERGSTMAVQAKGVLGGASVCWEGLGRAGAHTRGHSMQRWQGVRGLARAVCEKRGPARSLHTRAA